MLTCARYFLVLQNNSLQKYRFNLLKKHSIYHFFFYLVLINSFGLTIQGQEVLPKIIIEESAVDDLITWSADDSVYIDAKSKKVYLFGNAILNNAGLKISANYMELDMENKIVYATHGYDKDSNRIGMPKFESDAESFTAASLRYNMETKKGYIEEVRVKQDEIYLDMAVSKRQSNGEIHFRQGKFTTCDQLEPHYHFQLSRAVMIPNKRIVSGPMNLYIKGIPTPLGLPFAIIPQQQKRKHGIIFPRIAPSSQWGFGVQDFGYYIPINEKIQTTFFANLFSRGSWGLSNKTDYFVKYKNQGDFEIGFQQFITNFPDRTKNNKATVRWNHKSLAPRNPLWTFNSAVNFISDNQSKNNLNPLNQEYFNNSYNSDININRAFPGKPYTAGMKLSMRQNSISKKVALTSPVANFNVARFFPLKALKSKSNTASTWYEKIGMTYNAELQNRSEFADSLLKQNYLSRIPDQFLNGISQTSTIQTTFQLLKGVLKFTPSANYANRINFQGITKALTPSVLNPTVDSLIVVKNDRTNINHDFSFNAQFTTMVYAYYRFIGKKKSLLRHVLTPSAGFNYRPAFTKNFKQVTLPSGLLQTYNVSEQSIYASNSIRSNALLNFGINNTFELKQTSIKDSTGFKKTRLVDAFSLSSSYDFLADSLNLAPITLSLRINPIAPINIVLGGSYSLQNWNDSTGGFMEEYALASRSVLGRMLSTDISTTFTITSKESREKMKETNTSNLWNSDYQYFVTHPYELISFQIPWKINLSHIIGFTANTNRTIFNPSSQLLNHTIAANADVSFTKRWKLAVATNFDINSLKITNTRFTLLRDMHCWQLAFYWTPIGQNQSFLLSLNASASMLRDAKLDLRKPPSFF